MVDTRYFRIDSFDPDTKQFGFLHFTEIAEPSFRHFIAIHPEYLSFSHPLLPGLWLYFDDQLDDTAVLKFIEIPLRYDLPPIVEPEDSYETDPCAECYPRSDEGCAKCGLGLVGGDSHE